MNQINLFIPLTKIDVPQRLVYGVATAEREDRAGEICDYATTKPYYEQWSHDVEKASEGKSLGNVRAMHGNVAAGKVVSLSFDDAMKQIEVCAKIVDDDEWAKVCEGVYTGFSQGGVYVKRWRDASGLIRYTADPSEISLVDLPCLPDATFQVIKADGAVEMRRHGESQTLSKVGARHSRDDQERLQKAHDSLVELGARCGESRNEREDLAACASLAGRGEMLAEPTADAPDLRKAFDAIGSVLDEILLRVKRIENQPTPLPISGKSRAVSKSEELLALYETNPAGVGQFVETHRDALALEAIRLAQNQPQRMAFKR